MYPSIFQRSEIGGGHVISTLDVPTSLITNSDIKPGSKKLKHILINKLTQLMRLNTVKINVKYECTYISLSISKLT